MIHITFFEWFDVYLPIVLAILRKENSRREKERRKLLSVVFYSYYYTDADWFAKSMRGELGGKYLSLVGDWRNHPVFGVNQQISDENNKKNIYMFISNGIPGVWCPPASLIQKQKYRYRELRTKLVDCVKDGRAFRTPEELFEFLNQDFCHHN